MSEHNADNRTGEVEEFLRTATADQVVRLHDEVERLVRLHDELDDRENLVMIKELLWGLIEEKRKLEASESEASLDEAMG